MPKDGTSNAFFALYLTQDGSTVRYYALPSEDRTTMKLQCSVSDTTNVYVFSWRNFTDTKEISKPSFMISTNQPLASPPGGDCIENNQPPTSPGGDCIQQPTSPSSGNCTENNDGDCIKNNHKVCYCAS